MAFIYKHVFLVADNDKSTAEALTRLFGSEGHEVFPCGNGGEALDLLKNNGKVFSLIISARQLPDMAGLEFLKKAGKVFPYAMRILLSADSDLDTVVEAVENGIIDRCFHRHWNDNDLKLHTKGILEQYEMIVENRRLQALIKKQKNEIKQLSRGPEQMTEEDQANAARKTNKTETCSCGAPEKNLYATVKTFLAFLERYDFALAEHVRRVSTLARDLAEIMALPTGEILKIEMGGLLHDIGKVGFPAHLLAYDARNWTTLDKSKYCQHPLEGENLIGQLGKLEEVGRMIRSHHEQFDGRGFPDQLKEAEIPLGARIIAVANAFDNVYSQRIHFPRAVMDLIEQARPSHPHIDKKDIVKKIATVQIKKAGLSRYDPQIVEEFIKMVESKGKNYLKGIPLQANNPQAD